MSPSVMTSVALAPRLRIDETGLPISTSRVSTDPRIGARIVAFAQILVRAIGRRLGLRDLRARLGHLRLADRELRLRGALAVLGHFDARSARRRARTARSGSARTASWPARRCGARIRRPDPRLRRGSSAAAPRTPSSEARAACRLASAPRTGGGQQLLVELDEHVALAHDAVDVDVQRLDDAVRLRLDFDFGDRLDLAGGDHGADHRAAFDGGQPRRIDVGRRAFDGRQSDRARNDDRRHTEADVEAFARRAWNLAHTKTLTRAPREKFGSGTARAIVLAIAQN